MHPLRQNPWITNNSLITDLLKIITYLKKLHLRPAMAVSVFYLDIFIISFRESMEAAVIIGILLSFVKQAFGGPYTNKKTYRRLIWQVWIGSGIGLFCVAAIGGAFIGCWYSLGNDFWSKAEYLYEGILALIASIMITAMGLGMMRIEKMKESWRIKISRAVLADTEKVESSGKFAWIKRLNPKRLVRFSFRGLGAWSRKYAMLLLPLITILREGIELIVFIFGVTIGKSVRGYPLSIILGLICGCSVGAGLFLGGRFLNMKYFLIFSTCLLYLVADGLWSRSIWYLQFYPFSSKTGGDVAENGSGPGSYDPRTMVWHVDCCNPEVNSSPYGIFNALLGWQNTATYGSIISYNIYWIFLDVVICCLIYEERTGRFPIVGRYWKRKQVSQDEVEQLYIKAQAHAREQMADVLDEEETKDGILTTRNVLEISPQDTPAANGDLINSQKT